MNKRYTSFVILLFSFAWYTTNAQQRPLLTPLYEDYSAWNPAAFSPNGLFNGGVNYYKINSGLENAPTSMYASFHLPFVYQKMAVGGFIDKIQYANFSETNIGGAFNYKMRLREYSSLAGGLGASVGYARFGKDNFDPRDLSDNLLQSDDNTSFTYNFSAGAVYRHKFSSGFASEEIVHQFLGSLSAKQIIPGGDFIHGSSYKIQRHTHFYLLAAYAYAFSPNPAIIPSVYLTSSVTFDQPLHFALVFNADFNKIFEADLGMDTTGKILLGAGFSLNNVVEDDNIKIKLGSSYDTRPFTTGSRTGFTLSMFYTYDYDLTSYEL